MMTMMMSLLLYDNPPRVTHYWFERYWRWWWKGVVTFNGTRSQGFSSLARIHGRYGTGNGQNPG